LPKPAFYQRAPKARRQKWIGKWNAAAAGKPCNGHWEATKRISSRKTAAALRRGEAPKPSKFELPCAGTMGFSCLIPSQDARRRLSRGTPDRRGIRRTTTVIATADSDAIIRPQRSRERWLRLETLRPASKIYFPSRRVFWSSARQSHFQLAGPVLISRCGASAELRVQPMREPARHPPSGGF
jgi:hypothetical protein